MKIATLASTPIHLHHPDHPIRAPAWFIDWVTVWGCSVEGGGFLAFG
jgi:hypothetical protein